MNAEDLEREIIKIIATQSSAEVTDITNQTELLKDLKMSHSNIVDLTMVLEEKFNLQIPDEEMEKRLTIESIISYIKENRN